MALEDRDHGDIEDHGRAHGAPVTDGVYTGWRRSPWRLMLWVAVALLMVAPAIAMQLVDGIDWDAEDFAFAAVLLIGGAAAFEIAARLVRKRAHLALAGAVLLAVVLGLWAQGAVQLF
jgi:peptidoglycan/LPS O-acetylase OafA/YrhL